MSVLDQVHELAENSQKIAEISAAIAFRQELIGKVFSGAAEGQSVKLIMDELTELGEELQKHKERERQLFNSLASASIDKK